ncbi:angiotensin-converting enzyme-like [Elysia marginata]|uniref:Angiotensin-converting enzyme n=1 Tax=Elysia marginata TaxID=1093978 RepID=A0AAV4F3V4_9GAST|nr:angiotensin-converting enzyme-like [Elysia marginata]
MTTSRDPELLKRAWLDWRNAIGPPIRPLYKDYVNTLNIAANENGFADYSEYWKQSLFPDTPGLDTLLERLWHQVRPLYTQLHAYVRHKLTLKYGPGVVGTDGTIPAHLLGKLLVQNDYFMSRLNSK